MSHNYKVEETAKLAAAIKSAGFRVFLAERGTYGFFTDTDGTRVVSFQHDLGGFKFSGNYKAVKHDDVRQVGSGWVMGDVYNVSKANLEELFRSGPPRWATNGLAVNLTTLDQHLKTYQSSSKYVEFQPVNYRELAASQGFDIQDTDEGYTWSARNFVMDSASEFDTEQEAWENILANFPNIEV